jgi:hypothetical protein
MQKNKILSIANFLAFIATVIVNTLAITLPINGKTTGELSDLYPNLFVPAGITFSIWSVIYLLLLVFVIWQVVVVFKKSENARIVDAIGPWFIVSSLANCSWILAWHYVLPALSLFIMIVLLISLIKIYLILDSTSKDIPKNQQYFTYPIFSIYLGWLTVATIANTAAVLVYYRWQGAPLTEATWTIIMISVAIAMGLYFSLFKKDIFYSMVIVWALYGIFLKRSTALVMEEGIILMTKIGMAACIAVIFYLFFNKYLRPHQ